MKKKAKRSIAPLSISMLLLALLVLLISVMPLWTLPSASALGCSPLSLQTEGPNRSSLQGVVGFGNETFGPLTMPVYMVEPGSTVNMTFNVIYDPYGLIVNWTVIPHFGPNGASLDPRWFTVSYSPSIFVLGPGHERVDVTVTVNVSKDAPQLSEYDVGFEADVQGECGFGGGDFILRVGREAPAHAFTLSYLPPNSFGGASVAPVTTEGGRLKSLQVNLEKDSSTEVNLNLSSQYPLGLSFDMKLTNSSSSLPSSSSVNMTTSEFTATAVKGLYARLRLAGISYFQGRYGMGQHSSGNISFIFVANGTVNEGTYPLSLKIDDYVPISWFNNSKVEAVEVPIVLQIGKNAAATPTEQATDSSIYAWAVSATVAAVVALAVVVLLVQRRRK